MERSLAATCHFDRDLRTSRGLWLPLLLVLACSRLSMAAQEEGDEPGYTAVTTSSLDVPRDELPLMLLSLTKDELIVEADAWLKEVKAKVKEITDAELRQKRGDQTQAPAEAENPVRLRTEQAALVDRTRTVLAELKNKGGDIVSYETYLGAVTGLNIAPTDTGAWWDYLLSWLKSPVGGMRWVQMMGTFVAVYVVFWILARFAGRAVGRVVDRQDGLSNLLKDFAVKMAGRTVMVLGLLVALSAVGVEIGPMLAAIGAGGFILAFALQETLGNFASGMMIMIYRPFDVDDFVDVAGVAGVVRRMSLVSTMLVTPDNRLLVIPNKSVWGGIITNVTGNDKRRVDLVFGIGYDDDIQKAVGILERLVAEHELVLDDPAPTIKVDELADSSVNLICRPWVKTGDFVTVRWDLMRQVKEQFDAHGVSIPYPQQDVHMHQAATD